MARKISLPWGRRVSTGKESSFWEPFAVIVSAAAAGIALWQTFILQDQLTASDRNRSIQAAIEAAQNFCAVFEDLPFIDRVIEEEEQPKDPGISQQIHIHTIYVPTGKPFNQAYVDSLAVKGIAAERQLKNALAIVSVWNTKPVYIFSQIGSAGELIGLVKDKDFTAHAERLRSSGRECQSELREFVNQLTGRTVYPEHTDSEFNPLDYRIAIPVAPEGKPNERIGISHD